MRIYYINLDRRADRRSEMENQFARLGLAAERIAAVTPPDLTEEQKARSCDPRRRHWMTEVELCCSLSHIKALDRFLRDGGENALILEDDVLLSAALPAFLAEYAAQRRTIGILRLETDLYGQRLTPPVEAPINTISIRKSWSWAAGSAAYIVSREAARTIIESGELLRLQVDGALFNPYETLSRRIAIRHCLPALAIQIDRLDAGRQDSDIASSRAQHEAPMPLPPLQRVFRTLTGIAKTEILIGSQRLFHTIFGGARKMPVPFAGD